MSLPRHRLNHHRQYQLLQALAMELHQQVHPYSLGFRRHHYLRNLDIHQHILPYRSGHRRQNHRHRHQILGQHDQGYHRHQYRD